MTPAAAICDASRLFPNGKRLWSHFSLKIESSLGGDSVGKHLGPYSAISGGGGRSSVGSGGGAKPAPVWIPTRAGKKNRSTRRFRIGFVAPWPPLLRTDGQRRRSTCNSEFWWALAWWLGAGCCGVGGGTVWGRPPPVTAGHQPLPGHCLGGWRSNARAPQLLRGRGRAQTPAVGARLRHPAVARGRCGGPSLQAPDAAAAGWR